MATYVEERTLDLRKRRGRAGGIKPVVLRRGEQGAKISVKITDDDAAFDMTGHSAKFCAVNAGGGFLKSSATVTRSNPAEVLYIVGSQLTTVSGEVVVAYVELTSSGVTMTTDTLPILVLENTDISGEQAAAYQSQVDALIDQLDSAISSAGTATNAANSAAQRAETAADDLGTAKSDAQAATRSANSAASSANGAASAANTAAGNATSAATAANSAAGSANTAASAARSAATDVGAATDSANAAAGRANTAADEAEAFLKSFIVEYDNLSDECKAYIAQSASAGVELATDEDVDYAFEEIVAPAIASGNDAGRITAEDYEAALGIIFD